MQKDRYLGFEFAINGEIHYGWARLNVRAQAIAAITGYAYEIIPNKPIIAGDEGNTSAANNSGATLGELASGSLSRTSSQDKTR
jgi:hypothetical protein